MTKGRQQEDKQLGFSRCAVRVSVPSHGKRPHVQEGQTFCSFHIALACPVRWSCAGLHMNCPRRTDQWIFSAGERMALAPTGCLCTTLSAILLQRFHCPRQCGKSSLWRFKRTRCPDRPGDAPFLFPVDMCIGRRFAFRLTPTVFLCCAGSVG